MVFQSIWKIWGLFEAFKNRLNVQKSVQFHMHCGIRCMNRSGPTTLNLSQHIKSAQIKKFSPLFEIHPPLTCIYSQEILVDSCEAVSNLHIDRQSLKGADMLQSFSWGRYERIMPSSWTFYDYYLKYFKGNFLLTKQNTHLYFKLHAHQVWGF